MKYGYNQILMQCTIGWEPPQFHALTGCDTTSYFFVLERKLLLRKRYGARCCISSVNWETRVGLYQNQLTLTSTMTIPPDADSLTQAIYTLL